MNEPVFTPELIEMIVDEWNLAQQYEENEPLDGDEVDTLIEHLTKEINIHQGNKLEDEDENGMRTLEFTGWKAGLIFLVPLVPFVHGLIDMINKTVEYFK